MTLVLVHGGVSGVDKAMPGLQDAVSAGAARAHALDATEESVRSLEDHPELNAGYGAVLNRAGEVELDAAIVDGARGRWGGVANVRFRNPVSLARMVMERTPHVLLAGTGAQEAGVAFGLEEMNESSPEQHERWARERDAGRLGLESYGRPEHVDTVGAVVLDDASRLCAASSTGGVFGKLRGRVGDSPILGAGTYASAAAAVVGTGVGELFLETLACLHAGRSIEEGLDPQAACERTISLLGERQPVAAGLLALDTDGRVGAAFRGGSWTVWGPEGPVEAVCLGPARD
ncbi:MAG: isoaspartyl peptidase/L-asparaginase [Actinomycetota bacterium]|nr:isoaspartyl peptidase/L-asparaginase [Actinomycetota bacterium]